MSIMVKLNKDTNCNLQDYNKRINEKYITTNKYKKKMKCLIKTNGKIKRLKGIKEQRNKEHMGQTKNVQQDCTQSKNQTIP